MAIFEAAEQMMAEQMRNYDCSHDMYHIKRVRSLAEMLATGYPDIDKTVVCLGAIFHDLIDHKYAAKLGVTIDTRLAEVRDSMEKFTLPSKQISEIMRIICSVGYTKEKKLKKANEWLDWHENCAEFHCVQDADRLDAMGAIGIMRCAAYSCAVNQPLFDGTFDGATAFGHIEEKLVRLQSTLRTPLGRKLGEKRHKFMLDFQKQMMEEWEVCT